MDTLSQMRNAVQKALSVGGESTFFDPDTIDLSLNQAYRKSGGRFNWPELEDAKKTSTKAGHEYYDYPQNWYPDSIWKIKVDGRDMGDPLVYKDYLYETENQFPNGEKYIWSSQWRRLFMRINGEAPTVDGNNNICLWGQKVVELITDANPTTIFSYSMPECNEALVLEATAILRAKGEEEKRAEFKSAEALSLLTIAYKKIRAYQAKYEKTTPQFQVPDYFAHGKSRRTRIGNFD